MNRALAMLPLCAAFAAGCGSSTDRAAPGRVAARVNSDAITVQEVEAVLARGRHATPELAVLARREAIDRLIEQQLARQRAVAQRLDRAPVVLQAVEAAKSEILARAYLQQVAQAQARPTAEEVRDYYLQHPELFARRRLFSLEEIEMARKAGLAAALQERAAKGASMEQIADWLRLHEVQHTFNRGVRAAEDIPLELLSWLQAMKERELRVVESGDDELFVIRVVAARDAPVDEAAAAPLIEQFLLKRKWSEAVGMEMRRLRLAAHIEYVEERK
jgi:EpsD family peptidyl-prolyl cis-trans isomerase